MDDIDKEVTASSFKERYYYRQSSGKDCEATKEERFLFGE
jgi:hypothetical protein